MHQHASYAAVTATRSLFDMMTGYGPRMTEAAWLRRMIFLETVAGATFMSHHYLQVFATGFHMKWDLPAGFGIGHLHSHAGCTEQHAILVGLHRSSRGVSCLPALQA